MTQESRTKKDESLSLTDIVRKIAMASLGSAAMAREVVIDSKKPREMIGNLLLKAEKTKDDVLELLAREVNKFLGKINVSEEISKALKDLVVNISASIDFGDKKGTTKSRVKIKKADVLKKK